LRPVQRNLYYLRQQFNSLMPDPLPTPHHASWFSSQRYFFLFLSLLTALIIYPYAENHHFGYYAFRIMGSAAIVFCVYAASFRRSLVIIAIALSIPAFAQRVLNLSVDDSALSILNIMLSFAFDAFIVIVIFRRVFGPARPTAQTIYGALCIYLLMGFGFASVYGMITLLDPHAFYLNPVVNTHAVPNRLDFIYYSYATITSLGGTGVTPVSGEARSVTVIEALVGVLYLAVLISRLVGAYRHPSNEA
jgi:hypothetical protein